MVLKRKSGALKNGSVNKHREVVRPWGLGSLPSIVSPPNGKKALKIRAKPATKVGKKEVFGKLIAR